MTSPWTLGALGDTLGIHTIFWGWGDTLGVQGTPRGFKGHLGFQGTPWGFRGYPGGSWDTWNFMRHLWFHGTPCYINNYLFAQSTLVLVSWKYLVFFLIQLTMHNKINVHKISVILFLLWHNYYYNQTQLFD